MNPAVINDATRSTSFRFRGSRESYDFYWPSLRLSESETQRTRRSLPLRAEEPVSRFVLPGGWVLWDPGRYRSQGIAGRPPTRLSVLNQLRKVVTRQQGVSALRCVQVLANPATTSGKTNEINASYGSVLFYGTWSLHLRPDIICNLLLLALLNWVQSRCAISGRAPRSGQWRHALCIN